MSSDAARPGLAALSLEGRRALVTGGGSGLGRMIAYGLAHAGAEVVVVGRRVDALQESVAHIRLIGSRYGSGRPMVDFPRMVDLYLAGHPKTDELITRRYGLPEINEAHDVLAKGEVARALLVFD